MAVKIYTKTGDLGKTSLIGGTKVSKSDIRIETYGTIDELNSWIGVVNDHINDDCSKKYSERDTRLDVYNVLVSGI